jgi:hypothetical protein
VHKRTGFPEILAHSGKHMLDFVSCRYGCSVVFCTLTLGANPAYASECFYRSQLSVDRTRVERLFREAEEAGIALRHESVSWQSLRNILLTGEHLVILLVDKTKLKEGAGCCCGLIEPGYTGHYIVVSSFDVARQAFIVLDPACAAAYKTINPESLDCARCSFGTDEDVLIVARHRPADSTDSERSCRVESELS